MQQMRVRSLGQEDPLEEGLATHSSILAWTLLLAEVDLDCDHRIQSLLSTLPGVCHGIWQKAAWPPERCTSSNVHKLASRACPQIASVTPAAEKSPKLRSALSLLQDLAELLFLSHFLWLTGGGGTWRL